MKKSFVGISVDLHKHVTKEQAEQLCVQIRAFVVDKYPITRFETDVEVFIEDMTYYED